MKQNISPEEALEIILAQVAPLAEDARATSRLAALENSIGRVLAADIVAEVDLPPFDNSAVDGYAVIAADLESATQSDPVTLHLLDTVAAGSVSSKTLTSGTTVKIMTGAPLPTGATAVVMREDVTESASGVIFVTPARSNQHIRRAGSDVRRGELVIPAGTLVGSAQWSMLASLGSLPIPLYRRPKVALLITGDELAEPEVETKPGQIRESNSYALRGLLEECGAELVDLRKVPDDPAKLLTILNEVALEADAVITSGGVSAGDFDPVRDILLGNADVHFWKVNMKPGKPVMFAHYGGTPVFGLPGNPVSVMVSFEVFVRPALLKMAGRQDWRRPTLPALLASPVISPAGRTEFVRANLRWTGDGWLADVSGDQGSGRLSTMLAANALLEIPAETTTLDSGGRVRARLITLPGVN